MVTITHNKKENVFKLLNKMELNVTNHSILTRFSNSVYLANKDVLSALIIILAKNVLLNIYYLITKRAYSRTVLWALCGITLEKHVFLFVHKVFML